MQPGTLGPPPLAVVRGLAAAVVFALGVPSTPAAAREAPVERVSYTLDVKLDERRHVLEGEAAVDLLHEGDAPLARVVFALPLNAFKNDASVYYRSNGAGFRGGGFPRDWGALDVTTLAQERSDGSLAKLVYVPHTDDPADETTGVAELAEPAAPGAHVRLRIGFTTKLPSVVLRTGYEGSFHFAAQWFPKVAKLGPEGSFLSEPMSRFSEFAADFGTYDVTIDAPASFVVAAAGERTFAEEAGGRRRERRVLRHAHDFAFAAWDGFVVRERRAGDVLLRAYAPPGYDAVVERQLDAVAGALPFFAARYGPYPYPELVVVHPPRAAAEAGGMEYPGLLTTGGSPLVPRFARAPEIVAVHELGHQWFYGLFASDERRWPFLDEGLNSFAEMQAMGAAHGPASLGALFGLDAGLPAFQAVLGRWDATLLPIASPARAFPHGRAYWSLVYARTATVFETFRRVHGDEATNRALALYAADARFDHPTPEVLLGAFERVLGPGPTATLRTALFERGTVDFAVARLRSAPQRRRSGLFDEPSGRRTEAGAAVGEGLFEGSVDVERRGALAFPLDVELVRADGIRERRVWAGDEPLGRVTYEGPSPLVGVVLDPEGKVLLQDRFDNDHASVPAARSFPARVFARLLAAASLVVSAFGP